MAISILLVEDNLTQARLVMMLLEQEPDFVVAGHASDWQAAEHAISEPVATLIGSIRLTVGQSSR